jgi:hypothetical protein
VKNRWTREEIPLGKCSTARTRTLDELLASEYAGVKATMGPLRSGDAAFDLVGTTGWTATRRS